MTNGMLLLARLMMAACFVPAAIAHATSVSGLAFHLSAKGIPYADIIAAVMAVTKVFGPVLLVLGVAPRVTAGALVLVTAISTGVLHRFWEMVGPLRMATAREFPAQLQAAANAPRRSPTCSASAWLTKGLTGRSPQPYPSHPHIFGVRCGSHSVCTCQ